MIEIDETIRAFVYCRFALKQDLMVAVQAAEGGYTMLGRVRHYREDTGDPFEDRDEKSWFKGKKTYESVDEAVAQVMATLVTLLTAAELMGRTSPTPKIYDLRRGEHSLEEFMELFTSMPFTHKKVIEKETVQ